MRFYRGKYETKMTSLAVYTRWKEETGLKVTHKQWVAFWMSLKELFTDEVRENPAGVDLPLFMGNISVKILDNEFKGPEDMLHSSYKPSKEEPFQRKQIFTGDVPRRAKIVWQKHPLFMGLAATFGLQATEGFKKGLKKDGWMRNNINHYQKARKYRAKKSKHIPKPKKSLFN